MKHIGPIKYKKGLDLIFDMMFLEFSMTLPGFGLSRTMLATG